MLKKRCEPSREMKFSSCKLQRNANIKNSIQQRTGPIVLFGFGLLLSETICILVWARQHSCQYLTGVLGLKLGSWTWWFWEPSRPAWRYTRVTGPVGRITPGLSLRTSRATSQVLKARAGSARGPSQSPVWTRHALLLLSYLCALQFLFNYLTVT